MATPDEVNADMLAFWDGHGGRTWVAPASPYGHHPDAPA